MERVFWVYVLASETTGRRYTGSCEDLDRRLSEHNGGYSAATRHGVPWRLVHRERFATRSEAYQRERFLKTGRGREELDRILAAAQLG